MAQAVGAPSCNQRIEGLSPAQGTDLGCGLDPRSGHMIPDLDG